MGKETVWAFDVYPIQTMNHYRPFYTIINAIVGVLVLGGQWIYVYTFIYFLSLLRIPGCSHRPCPCPWCRWCQRAWCPAGSSARCWGAGPGWSVWPAPPPWHWARPAHALTRGSRSRCPRSGCPGTRGPACPQARWPARPPAATWTRSPGTRGAGAAGSSPRPSPAEIRPPGDVKDIRGHPRSDLKHTQQSVEDRGRGRINGCCQSEDRFNVLLMASHSSYRRQMLCPFTFLAKGNR